MEFLSRRLNLGHFSTELAGDIFFWVLIEEASTVYAELDNHNEHCKILIKSSCRRLMEGNRAKTDLRGKLLARYR